MKCVENTSEAVRHLSEEAHFQQNKHEFYTNAKKAQPYNSFPSNVALALLTKPKS